MKAKEAFAFLQVISMCLLKFKFFVLSELQRRVQVNDHTVYTGKL